VNYRKIEQAGLRVLDGTAKDHKHESRGAAKGAYIEHLEHKAISILKETCNNSSGSTELERPDCIGTGACL
jgi:hypothetical protein